MQLRPAPTLTPALHLLSQTSCLQLNVSTLPKSAAAALARLAGLSNLSLRADQITPAAIDSVLGLSRLTSLALAAVKGLLPAQKLPELPQRLPLLTNLELSEGIVEGSGLEDAQLPAPADFPNLRTYAFEFEFCRRRFQVGCASSCSGFLLHLQALSMCACGGTGL